MWSKRPRTCFDILVGSAEQGRTLSESTDKQWIEDQVKQLGPWHHNIQITDELNVGILLGTDPEVAREHNGGVSLIEPSEKFYERIEGVFPDGMVGKRFLDCACNAGVYCFFARHAGAEYSYGFDIREHWINQANFIKQNRTVTPTDRIDFEVLDLYDLPGKELEPFDFTFFSGIFYHLPDPILGLKIAADVTSDVIVVNTASIYDPDNPGGLTPRRRTSSDYVMSGVSELAWFPNGPKAILLILNWLGFREFKLTKFIQKEDRHRFEIFAAREIGRLENLRGSKMNVRQGDFS